MGMVCWPSPSSLRSDISPGGRGKGVRYSKTADDPAVPVPCLMHIALSDGVRFILPAVG